jgi:hypothetical protein
MPSSAKPHSGPQPTTPQLAATRSVVQQEFAAVGGSRLADEARAAARQRGERRQLGMPPGFVSAQHFVQHQEAGDRGERQTPCERRAAAPVAKTGKRCDAQREEQCASHRAVVDRSVVLGQAGQATGECRRAEPAVGERSHYASSGGFVGGGSSGATVVAPAQ